MINSNPKFKPVSKDRWFYDRFELCVSFELTEATILRDGLNHAEIDQQVSRRKVWREAARIRWKQFGGIPNRHGWRRRWTDDITDETVANLHDISNFLQSVTVPYKMVISMDQVWFYSNDPSVISQLTALPYLTNLNYTQAVIERPKDTVKLQRSKYQYRSYFKAINMTLMQQDQLIDFLLNQKQHIRLSPGLAIWVEHPLRRTQDYFFVDHDNEQWVTMLSLVVPGLIRKTMHIIPAK